MITRIENGVVSQELYDDNRFAELQDDKIVAVWDFKNDRLTMLNHYLRIYTQISLNDFKLEMKKQNDAQLNTIKAEMEKESAKKKKKRNLMNKATLNLFQQMQPALIIIDTINVCGYKSYEYNIYNGEVITQKLWISKALQERINREVEQRKIWALEDIFKDNREQYFQLMGIRLDPVSEIIESIEESGYIVRRSDYGLRAKNDKSFEDNIDKQASFINDVKEIQIEPDYFTKYEQLFTKLSYSAYQVAVLREAEKSMRNN
jgi:hypothetical protein